MANKKTCLPHTYRNDSSVFFLKVFVMINARREISETEKWQQHQLVVLG